MAQRVDSLGRTSNANILGKTVVASAENLKNGLLNVSTQFVLSNTVVMKQRGQYRTCGDRHVHFGGVWRRDMTKENMLFEL